MFQAVRKAEAPGWEYRRINTMFALVDNRFGAVGFLDDMDEAWLRTGEQVCATQRMASWSCRVGRPARWIAVRR